MYIYIYNDIVCYTIDRMRVLDVHWGYVWLSLQAKEAQNWLKG